MFAFNVNNCVMASDYKYKVLDPKYNPEAEQLLAGKLPPIRTMPPDTNKGFDLGTFLAIFALVTFPIGIVYIAVRTFKEIMEPYDETTQKPVIGNIRIESDKTAEEQEIYSASQCGENLVTQTAQKPTDTKQIPDTFVKKYCSSPIESIPNPMLLYTAALASNKGFCLVEYNNKFSLIGYINEEIFLLNQFEKVKTTEIRSRISDATGPYEKYIVRLGDYKALVQVTDKKMELLIDL